MEDPALWFDGRGSRDEHFSRRLSCWDQQSIEADVVNKATVWQIATAVVAVILI
jgi:hypothetical protein